MQTYAKAMAAGIVVAAISGVILGYVSNLLGVVVGYFSLGVGFVAGLVMGNVLKPVKYHPPALLLLSIIVGLIGFASIYYILYSETVKEIHEKYGNDVEVKDFVDYMVSSTSNNLIRIFLFLLTVYAAFTSAKGVWTAQSRPSG